MRLRRSAPAVTFVVVAVLACLPAAPSAATGGACGFATANRLLAAQHLANGNAAQVLCGAFLGAGSKAMVVSLATPGCGLSIGWAVYRSGARGWRRVFLTNNGALLGRNGTRIRTWQGVLAPGDAHCLPSSYRVRDWRWNGTRLVAGAWHPSSPPPTPLPGTPSA